MFFSVSFDKRRAFTVKQPSRHASRVGKLKFEL